MRLEHLGLAVPGENESIGTFGEPQVRLIDGAVGVEQFGKAQRDFGARLAECLQPHPACEILPEIEHEPPRRGLGDLGHALLPVRGEPRSEEHTSELPSLMRISYAVFSLNKNTTPHYAPPLYWTRYMPGRGSD